MGSRIKKPDYIRFAAEYEDGSVHHFNIPTYTIQKTDTVAGIIAHERQTKGELPPGKIKDVYRAHSGGKFP
jgi:hypothetical protein